MRGRRGRLSRRAGTVAALVAACVLWPGVASAHPLGNFTINLGSRLEVFPGRVQLAYVVDMAEIPTQQAKPDIDTNEDGSASADELEVWATATAADIANDVAFTVDGAPVALRPTCATAREAPGQADLPVLRLEAGFAGDVPASGRMVYADHNFDGHLGWHEVTAVGVDGVSLSASSVPVRSVSDQLRAYPQDRLSSPLDVRGASFSYGPGASEAAASSPCADDPTASPVGGRPGVTGGGFASLVARSDLTPWVVVLSLALALGFGALHALGPGHGKSLMAAYLVGAGGRPRQAVAVGGAVAVMHTASVLALGLLVLSLERTFSAERVYPWLGLASGLVALGLGAGLLVQRLGVWSNARRTERDHHREHGHENGHEHGSGGHAHAVAEGPVLSRRGLMALAVAGGILPSPTALVVLLSAVSFHRVGFGLSLIGMFSVGLATALIIVGLAALRAREAVTTRLSSTVGRLIPVFSAGVIVAVGLFLTARGVAQL